MKTNILLSMLAAGLFLTASGQNTLDLNFSANYNGQYLQLDYILIQNLTQGGDTTLYWPDTTLVLDYNISGTGSHDSEESSFTLSPNFPNPFREQTTIHLNLPESELIKITLRDMLGRELQRYQNHLAPGGHSFTIHAGGDQYYLLTVTGAEESRTIKMVSLPDAGSRGGSCRIVHSGNTRYTVGFKSMEATNGFDFSMGDTLRYTGYAQTPDGILGNNELQDTPQSTSNYEFTIIEGTRCPGNPTVTDIDGNTYNTVQIGSQCWMAENLKTGTMIPGTDTMQNNGILEKYCYDNNEANCEVYGGLYQFYEMMQYVNDEGVQGICPEGWHLPTDEEWKMLEGAVDSQYDYPDPVWDETGDRGFDAGDNLKTTSGWNNNQNGTNIYGFGALPAGHRSSGGGFTALGSYTDWWTSTVGPNPSGPNAWRRYLTDLNVETIARFLYNKDRGFSVRCVKEGASGSVPTVETTTVSDVTAGSAVVEGEIIAFGGTGIMQHGHCWSTAPNPTIVDPRTELGAGSIGSFTSNLTYLDPETTYYVRAYATNSYGTAYGSEASFETEAISIDCPPTVDDIDGNTYNTVQIGSQCWMAENLKTGTMIPGADTMQNDGNIEKYCHGDNAANCDEYGGLYQFDEMMQYVSQEGVQGICPEGWHLPTDEEWKILEGEVDSQYGYPDPVWDGTSFRGYDAGKNLKTTSGWSNNGNGTDLYGFGAQPGGSRAYNGEFGFLGDRGFWWSSSDYSGGTFGWSRYLAYGMDGSYRGYFYPVMGFSVRCLKD